MRRRTATLSTLHGPRIRRLGFGSAVVVPSRPYEPCLPTIATIVPTGSDWVHELKHDGFRLIIHRDGDRVQLFTRRGYDWSGRFPRIIDQARRLKPHMFVIDA
jgi:ATP-dependent DNA ligase